MRTARFFWFRGRGSLYGPPAQRPPGQRPPSWEDSPGQRPPPGKTPLDRDPLPGQRPPRRNMGPENQTGSDIIQRLHLWAEWLTDTSENITLPQTSFAGLVPVRKSQLVPTPTESRNSTNWGKLTTQHEPLSWCWGDFLRINAVVKKRTGRGGI